MTTRFHALLRFACMAMLLATAFCTGGIVTISLRYPPAPLYTLHAPPQSDVPVVRIEGILNSALVGSLQGDVRLFAGDRQVLPTQSGAFAVQDAALLVNRIEIVVPKGMKFVASKRGSKYYDVSSAEGMRIVPENRLYFASAAAAEQAGYRR